METWTVKHPALGIELDLTGTRPPEESDIWEAIKMTIDPKDMFDAYNRGEKKFVRDAYRNGYFEGGGIGEALEHVGELGKSGVTGIYHGFGASLEGASLRRKYGTLHQSSTLEKYGGKLVEHKESIDKGGIYLHGLLESDHDPDEAMDLAIKRSGMGWWPDQKEVKKWIAHHQGLYEGDKARATAYKSAGNIIGGYSMMRELGGAWLSQAILEDEEQIDNWIETYAEINKLEKARQRSAKGIALVLGDEELWKKLRTGKVAPHEGMAFIGEIIGDPANLAGLAAAKMAMAPVRASLTGLTRRTLVGLQGDLAKQTALKGRLAALGRATPKTPAAVKSVAARVAETEASLVALTEDIAKRTSTLGRYGGQGFVGRLTGSPVSALAAEEALDLTTEAGKAASMIVRDVLVPRAPKTLVSRLAGGGMQALGAPLEVIGRTLTYLRQMPENAALVAIQKVTAKELTEQEAKTILLKLTAGGGVAYALYEEGDVGAELLGGLAVYLGPKALATVGRDLRVIGHELALAKATDPFFRRLRALPTPAEGLAGAAKDRTNVLTQGFWQATKAAATDPAKLSFRGVGMGVVGETPYVSGLTKGVARFLDTTGGDVGRFLEGTGRFGGAMAEGTIIPAGIGFVGAGGEPVGAVVGATISAPFTMVGAGLGKLANFRNAGEMAQKTLGDVEYYRDHLTSSERREFDAMPLGLRMALASESLSSPDLIIQGVSRGKSGKAGSHQVLEDGSMVTYNKDAESPMRHVFAHEGSHHMESHGLTAQVNRIMFGDPELGIAGVYVKRNAKGEPVYLKDAEGKFILDDDGRRQWELSEEFHKYRDDYMTRLRRTEGIKPAEMDKYEQIPELMGREIFAEMGADLQLSGALRKHLDRGPIGNLLAGMAKVVFPESFTKKLMLKLGVPIDKNGAVVGTGIFKNLQRVPEIDALIKKYKRDTAGKRADEIEAAFPVSKEYEQSFSVKDQGDPNVQGVMNTGGVFKTNPDGSLQLDVMRRPIRMTEGEIQKRDAEASAHALKVLEKHGVAIDEVAATKDGVEVIKKSATFKNLTEEMIDDLAKGPWHPRQIETLRNIARALREGDGQEAGFLLGYFAASRGRKAKALPYKVRMAFPYQFKLTQGGNILVELLDPNILTKNLKYLKKRFPREAAIFDSDTQVFDDLRIYTANQVAGRPGATGLGDEKAIFLNALLGGFTKTQVELNPLLREIGYKMASSNKSRSPFGVALRSFRLDRIFSAERSGEGLKFDYHRAERLMMPRGDDETVPLPFIEDLGGEQPSAGFRRVATEKMRKADYEKFQEPLSDAEMQEALGNQSQVQEFQPRFPRGDEQYMPAAYHGTPHTFKAEEGAPLGRFRSTQIGTGEGAQAYGHGLYFAGKKQVAEHYRKELGEPAKIKVNGKPIQKVIDEVVTDRDRVSNSHQKRFKELQAKVSKKPYLELSDKEMMSLNRLASRDETLLKLDKEISKIEDIESGLDALMRNESPQDVVKQMKNKIDLHNVGGKREYSKESIKYLEDIDYESAGSLYKVELAPKENEYLLWDKPLSEQPKGVREKLKGFDKKWGRHMSPKDAVDTVETALKEGGKYKHLLDDPLINMTGKEIYEMQEILGGGFREGGPVASATLLEAGIPGIKYLEGASRAKGKGDYNYVIFDEGAVTITEKMFMPSEQMGRREPYKFSKAELIEAQKIYEARGGQMKRVGWSKGKHSTWEYADKVLWNEILEAARKDKAREAGDPSAQFMPAMDREYLAAVEKGDVATTEKMVEKTARDAGFTKTLYHSGRAGTSLEGEQGPLVKMEMYFAETPEGVLSGKGRQLEGAPKKYFVKLDPKKIFKMRPGEASYLHVAGGKFRSLADKGFDAAIAKIDKVPEHNELVIFDPRGKVKSADPVTYDAQGKPIPLSKRFDPSDPNIMFMPAERAGAPRSYRGAAPILPPRTALLSDASLKSLEGDKRVVQAKLTVADYPDNPNPNSVALPARAGLVNPKIAGMPRTYADVRAMVETQVDRILDIAKKNPEFAKRSANFYGDMAESALNLADATKIQDRSLYDVADLQLRFLSLGSPRSSVPANATKSSRSIMAAHGDVAGYKINPGSQQKGAMLTAKDWDKGGHFDVLNPDLPGAADKVRNFYLNGLAELIDVAVARGDLADATMLRDRAARTLGLLKGKERMTKKVEGKLEKFFDGLATVDMWDMAAKGYAHPAYVPPGKGRGQTQNAPFQWSVPKHRVKAKTKGRIWERALQDMGVESLGDLNYQQARALQIDGRKDWNAESWDRWLGELEQLAEEGGPLTLAEEMGSMEPFAEQIGWSYYKKADEAGLNPGGKGPLYDAHQTIDGLIADSLNEAGMAEFFGKKKLTARNAQEILWAIEKLDNPLPANQQLVLFGDRITPFYEAIQILRKTGMRPEQMPDSARAIFDAIQDTYAKASTQSIPLEVSTWGTTPRAQAIQAQEAAMGKRRLTESVARGLREDIQRIADQHDVEIVIDEVKLGDGGYEEGGVAYVSPNISVTLRGDPVNTSRVMRALSLVWDQDGGNLIRKPTIEELNAGKKLNSALVFNTKGMTSAQKSAFFLEMNALKDAKGDSFLTGFTETQDGMFIGDQFYSGNLLAEYVANKASIDAIRKTHGVKDVNLNKVVIETFHRLDPEVSSQFPKVVRDSFTRDLYRMAHDRIGTAQARKPSKATQTLNQAKRIREQSAEVVGKEFSSDSAKTKARNDMLSQVDLLHLRGGITERGAVALKNQVKADFEQARVRSREEFGRTQAKAKKFIHGTISDPKVPKYVRRNALWAAREEFTPTQFENRMKGIMTGEQKSIELIPGRFRAKSGVKLPRSFQEPQQTGRWQRK